MNDALHSWAVIVSKIGRYLGYRMGLGKCPEFMPVRRELMVVLGTVLGWNRNLRVVETQRCPRQGPAIFVGNHVTKDDPFYMFRVGYLGSDGGIQLHAMMRDGFFSGILKSRMIDADEVLLLMGVYPISRDNVQLSQMKRFVRILRSGGSFLMYPGRSRTRTGLLLEYRDGIDEPGGVSLFLAQAQRGHPEVKIAAVPALRTHNPVTGNSAFVFGDPLYLPPDADRAAQRAFDYDLVLRMAEQAEINLPQVLACLLYLRCLHGQRQPLDTDLLADNLKEIFAAVTTRHVDPAIQTDLAGELRRTLRYFQSRGLLKMHGDRVELLPEAILSAPAHDTRYAKNNVIKFLLNQILHMTDITSTIERVVLR